MIIKNKNKNNNKCVLLNRVDNQNVHTNKIKNKKWSQ